MFASADRTVGWVRIIVGTSEIGMVEDVEELGAKPKRYLLGQAKLLPQSKTNLPSPEASEDIPPQVALLTAWRRNKSCRIESLATRIRRPIKHQRHPRLYDFLAFSRSGPSL
jgi:hypothetical protein